MYGSKEGGYDLVSFVQGGLVGRRGNQLLLPSLRTVGLVVTEASWNYFYSSM